MSSWVAGLSHCVCIDEHEAEYSDVTNIQKQFGEM